MAETDSEFKDWIFILNVAKKNALEKELFDSSSATNSLSNDICGIKANEESSYERTLKKLIKDTIRKIVNIEGNERCCDCGAPEPDWLVTNLGVLVCIECCGVHREMGVQISKTQSLKIDRLASSQLIIAQMSGNKLLNKIFEANIQAKQQLQANSSSETRQRFIKAKYESHMFVKSEQSSSDLPPLAIVKDFFDFVRKNDSFKVFELLLYLFAQNLDLMSPISDDEHSRNILQTALISMDEIHHLYLIDFLVQNRDYPRNKFSLNHQDREGNTALHYCAIYNQVESTKLLLKANACVKIKNRMGHSALDLAVNLEHPDVVKQIGLFLQGKPVDKIDLMCLYDRDYMSDSADDLYSPTTRPASTMSLTNDDYVVDDVTHAYTQINTGGNGDRNLHNYKTTILSNPASSSSYVPPKGYVKVLPQLADIKKKSLKTKLLDKNISEKVITETVFFPNKYKAVANYASNEMNNLTFRQHDMIIVTEKPTEDIWIGYLESNPEQRGYFPSKLVNMYV